MLKSSKDYFSNFNAEDLNVWGNSIKLLEIHLFFLYILVYPSDVCFAVFNLIINLFCTDIFNSSVTAWLDDLSFTLLVDWYLVLSVTKH